MDKKNSTVNVFRYSFSDCIKLCKGKLPGFVNKRAVFICVSRTF